MTGHLNEREVDGYLSRLAQAVWPDAVVYKIHEGELGRAETRVPRFTLERPGVDPLGLGSGFQNAKAAIEALRRQKEASHGTQGS